MKKEAFDKIYHKFMNEKAKIDRKREDIRKQQEIAKEKELIELEKSRKRVGSKTRVDGFIQKVQKDLRNRMCKAETLRQKKCIDEETKLKEMFKPKTNITKEELVQIRKTLEFKTKDNRASKSNLISYDNDNEFDNGEYEL